MTKSIYRHLRPISWEATKHLKLLLFGDELSISSKHFHIAFYEAAINGYLSLAPHSECKFTKDGRLIN